jgi:Protein of unknown function (DUF3501)
MSLEQYSNTRAEFRTRIIAHKKIRTVHVGPNVTWCFEDRRLVQYQVQEMLRIEKIFEAAGIEEELAAYNPLIPDGANWKATLLIEFPEPDVRKTQLAQLKGVEDRCWVQVDGCERVFAIADEDLDRENDEKTSSVHFLRFELTTAMVKQAKSQVAINVGVDHSHYQDSLTLNEPSRISLVGDLA